MGRLHVLTRVELPNAVPVVMAGVFFFNDTATTEIYTLSLHDALPISLVVSGDTRKSESVLAHARGADLLVHEARSEEHTSELQSRPHLVCRLLLEKKNKKHKPPLYSQIKNNIN